MLLHTVAAAPINAAAAAVRWSIVQARRSMGSQTESHAAVYLFMSGTYIPGIIVDYRKNADVCFWFVVLDYSLLVYVIGVVFVPTGDLWWRFHCGRSAGGRKNFQPSICFSISLRVVILADLRWRQLSFMLLLQSM